MSNLANQLTICRMTPEEVEKILLNRFGEKLVAVDSKMVAKRRKQQALYNERKNGTKD